MPKLKTNRSAAKRFKVTAKGLVKHRKSFRNHILTKKSKKRKAHLNATGYVGKSDLKLVTSMLNG